MAKDTDVGYDSSSEDDAPDLASWKALVKPKSPATGRVQPNPRTRIAKSNSPSEDQSSISAKGAFPSLSGFQAINKPARPAPAPSLSQDVMVIDDGVSEAEDQDQQENGEDQNQPLHVYIRSEMFDRSEYEDFTGGRDQVLCIRRALQNHSGDTVFDVVFGDYHSEEISRVTIESLTNGRQALTDFATTSEEQTEIENTRPNKRARLGTARMSSTRPLSGRHLDAAFVSTVDIIDGSDEDLSEDDLQAQSRRNKRNKRELAQYARSSGGGEDETMDEDTDRSVRSARRSRHGYATKLSTGRQSARQTRVNETDDDDLSEFDLPKTGRRKERAEPLRHSERVTRHRGAMGEVDVEDIYRSDSEQPLVAPKPKSASTREIFNPLPRNNEFRRRHNLFCDSCKDGTNAGPLIDCQGCSLAYHKSCLGSRTTRNHLVTKINEEDFVLQCRRCIAFGKKKDPNAPDLGKCEECRQHGVNCRPFRRRTTSAQEEKAREENDGIDPTFPVDPGRINNIDNVLFRCINCFRGFHYYHLPSKGDIMDLDMEVDAEQRFREYSREWKCKDCMEQRKVSGLVAWKPVDEDTYDPALGYAGVEDDEKIYLVRWEGKSYFQARWMPGAWVAGVTNPSMRKAFADRDDARQPKMRIEDAIPEDYLRTDIVLNIKYTSIVNINTEEIDKARIREVDKALIKYKGLGYEDAVWEAPPSPEDGDRWSDFVIAYNDWVAGRYVRQPNSKSLRSRLEKARNEEFSKLEKANQPASIEGGKLMEYQIEGLNWLYYKWFCRKNAILADEMGLGKTVQIIGFIATLVQDWNCFPFLVVVPNSTCPNWRREIKRWAPSLRIVAYYGSRESREFTYRYELYPHSSKDLRAHIVVTSYDAAADENCRKFFRGVPWQGLIVDEGQRLKNDNSLLFGALQAMKAPFKILLTGTPLQNNQRELFNLLHFLDDSLNAAELEVQYQELDQEKIAQLHEMIRPFFLRRTKAQVLTFLPPMAQIIVPVSMTIVQKTLYKNILAKNPDLLRAIFSTECKDLKQPERASLSNILMQLRKCLCHPFVYNKGIEDRNVSMTASHRNLVDASSKLKLLELLLPKLKERGHRVLIFSQFLDHLDIVEDFLDGMELRYQRLDGSISALEKQKRIDAFNAPNSVLFAFLLSTRAGGVGINLATADTVIILDPDFNPHQDIQALSRAHRIGQQNKVLCFHLVTRVSAEERIMQIGRKKLALEHVLIRQMDVGDADETDMVSVLRYGVSELFQDNGETDIVYDSLSVERLLDRSHMENTKTGEQQTAENQFAFARVWANDQGSLQEANVGVEEQSPDPGAWANILKERERLVAQEAVDKAAAFGRGRRARQHIDYAGDPPVSTEDIIPPEKRKRRAGRNSSESDTDFQVHYSDEDEELPPDGEDLEHDELADISSTGVTTAAKKDQRSGPPTFRRVTQAKPASNPGPSVSDARSLNCHACQTFHEIGSCPLKLAGVEHCNLCGIAHFGHARVCPHIQSEAQVRAMLEALKYSSEPEHLVNEARRYLRGLKGHLVQSKKQQELRKAEREAQIAAAATATTSYPSMQPRGWLYYHNGQGPYSQQYFDHQVE